MTDETGTEPSEEIDTNMDMPEPGVKVEPQDPPIPGAESTDETEDASAGDSSEDTGDDTDTEVEVPEYVEQDHLRYLDALQESGDINMNGAAPYLAQTFDITRGTAKLVLEYWKEQK